MQHVRVANSAHNAFEASATQVVGSIYAVYTCLHHLAICRHWLIAVTVASRPHQHMRRHLTWSGMSLCRQWTRCSCMYTRFTAYCLLCANLLLHMKFCTKHNLTAYCCCCELGRWGQRGVSYFKLHPGLHVVDEGVAITMKHNVLVS